MTTPPDPPRPSLWQRLRRPSARYSLGTLLVAGFAVGVMFWGGMNTALEWTNREAFCIGCHVMYDNVYVEYQETVHYHNPSGVRATCADCHVPREWGPKMIRKMQASRELWGSLTGTIDTREKFEAKRLTLARREWQRMLANDSLECRNCHGLVSMDLAGQSTRAARQHAHARDQGMTCIMCHQGIAHHLPEGMEARDDLAQLLPVAAADIAAASSIPASATALAATQAMPTDTTDPTATAPDAEDGSIDWEQIEGLEVVLLYPGVAHLGWVAGDVRIGRDRHGGGWAFRNGESCYACHFDETARMGQRIASGAKLEPTPIAGKAASIAVQVQAAHDGANLHLRFRWVQPAAADGDKMDPVNPVKLAFMLDAGGVEGAERNGCWASCHANSSGMPEAEPERRKYVRNGSLADGVFYDLVQWRSGDNRGYDGHVADTREMAGGSALIQASGTLEGDTWTVHFVRSLSGGEGDITLEPGKVYNFGFAIHDGHTAGRFHHVSLGYTLGIDAGALISARRR